MERHELEYALKLAMKKHKLVAIAEDAGIPKSSLQQFSSSGSMGEDRRKLLERWLLTHGYGPENSTANVRNVMAQELRLVASVLENTDIPDEIAAQRFKSLFDAYGRALAAARRDEKK